MAATWRGHGTIKYGTWNVRSLAGKEMELLEEMEKVSVKILAVTETKKKGNGCIELEGGHMLIYSGAPVKERARAGVAFLVHRDLVGRIEGWKSVNERLLTLQIRENETREKWTLVVAYGPNEDELAEVKDNFFDSLQKLVDDEDGNKIVLGDLNGRVGKCRKGFERVLGQYGEDSKNNNGKRLLQFCVANDLVLLNTIFPHKEIHRYTREEQSRNEKSIIDYILIERRWVARVRDARVKRGPEIGSDHYMVMMNMSIPNPTKPKRKCKKEILEKIKISNLKNKAIQQEYASVIEKEKGMLGQRQYTDDLENAWMNFKTVVLKAAEEVCGKVKCGRTNKRTRWWTQDVKDEVKRKKRVWKEYLAHKNEETYERYKAQRKRVKELVLKEKEKSWKEFGEFMDKEAKSNQKLFYRVLRNMRRERECPIKFIKGEDGNIINEPKRIMERWKEYFKRLLGGRDRNDNDNGQNDEGREAGMGSNTSTVEMQQGEDDPIEREEMWDALERMKLGKSAGHDGIAPEMLRYMGNAGEELFFRVLELAWYTKKIPKDWEMAIIVPIFKKGDTRECANHRGISLLSVPGKVYSRILERRLRKEIEHRMEEEQYGFRPNRSAQDPIFALRQLCEKSIEYNKEVYLCFIDLEKAFDRVPWSELWTSLRNKQVPEALIERIKSFYKNCTNYVRTSHLKSPEFVTTMGVRQGDIGSPLYFISLMDEVIKECKRKTRATQFGYWKLQPMGFSTFAFADDLVLIADTEEKLQENINIWSEELEKRNMTINATKTKCMVVARSDYRVDIHVNHQKIEQVSSFKYLGVMISADGKIKEEISQRITAAGKLFHAINKKFLSKREVGKDTKMAIYKSTLVPTLTYGSESWALKESDKSRLQSMEMRFLRKIEGKTRRDRIRNQTIRTSLKSEPLIRVVERGQLRWFGHVMRQDDSRHSRRAMETRMTGRRPRGRRRMTWEDNLRSVLRARELSWVEARKLATDRDRWHSLCKSSTPEGRRGSD